MADSVFDKVYNPDVLSCLANLSNDEYRRNCSETPTRNSLTLHAKRAYSCAKSQNG